MYDLWTSRRLRIKQVANHKSALHYYCSTYMANYGGLSDEVTTLAHFEGHHFRSTIIYSWTLLEEQVTNAIETQDLCGRFWFVAKISPTVRPPLGLFPQGKANKSMYHIIDLEVSNV